jgi:hypothetical protein
LSFLTNEIKIAVKSVNYYPDLELNVVCLKFEYLIFPDIDLDSPTEISTSEVIKKINIVQLILGTGVLKVVSKSFNIEKLIHGFDSYCDSPKQFNKLRVRGSPQKLLNNQIQNI